MPAFWLTYIARSFLRSGRRAGFAAICVVVGVAGVVSLQTAALTVQHALTSNVRAANGGDVSLATDEVPLSRADLGLFDSLQRQGRLSSWTAVASVHATAVGSGGRLVPFEVDLVSVPPYPIGGQPAFVSPSNGSVANLLTRHGDVLVTTVLAQELGVEPGSRLLVSGIGGTGLHATVRGILAETSLSHSAAMTVEARDTAAVTASALRYTAVYLNVRGPSDTVAALLRSRFPSDTVQTVSEALQTAQQEVHDFRQFLLLVGLLALLIAGVGILNAMQSILARRRLEIAMLKAMGFREWALYILFGGEAVLIGLIGGLLGTALGAAGSKIITEALARALGVQVAFVLDAGTILAGVALGVGATLVFTAIPIVRAADLRPLEVLREGTPPSPAEWSRAILLLALVFLLFTALTAVVLADTVLAAKFVVGVSIACAALAGLLALAVGWIGRLGPTGLRPTGVAILLVLVSLTALAVVRVPALAPIAALATILYGLTVALPAHRLLPLLIGARSLSRRLVRTSLILVAFLAGVLAMTVTLTVALGLQSQVSAILASHRAQNLVAVTGGDNSGPILRASRSLPGIHGRSVMTTIATEPVRVNGRPLASFIAADPRAVQDDPYDRRLWALNGLTGWPLAQGKLPPNIQIVAGRALGAGDAGTNHVLLVEGLMGYPYYLQPGDTITMRETGNGRRTTIRVTGFYARPRRGERFAAFSTPPVYADRQLVLRLGGADVQTVVSFSADQKSLARDAAALQQALPGVLVVDVGDLTAIVDTILNELLHLLAVLTALVLGAGIAVVANGVALAMLERRREIALFKAVGFGPGSVQSFVLVENALIGVLAGAVSVFVTAVALGLLSHYAFNQAIGFDPVLAMLVLLIAAAMAVMTAFLSARAPIRIRPLEALRND
ncbi:MAG: FtsX-like permease family protein [Chloroflexi bacterium]|nr:FtsX-like permease family protein [Chloroflexota bacterium]